MYKNIFNGDLLILHRDSVLKAISVIRDTSFPCRGYLGGTSYDIIFSYKNVIERRSNSNIYISITF